ncbi:alpha/beta fold hydrolase [Natrinema sp. SYSU A 869]|uniref:alpha/beta fold hydrolase n=1 Tax=Natrinema sp. SYSU A 869 TaxID=2871694 RepID=UPI0031F3107D
MAYEREGSGPPLILLHGGSGTRRTWDTLRPHLTDDFTLIVPDRRGRGESGDADAFLETILPPERYGDPDDPLGSVLFWPPDPQRLLSHHRVGSWLRLAAALTAAGSTGNNRAVQMGPPLEQQALSHTTHRISLPGAVLRRTHYRGRIDFSYKMSLGDAPLPRRPSR